jgi:lysozyme
MRGARRGFWIALAVAGIIFMLSKTNAGKSWIEKLASLLGHEEGERLTVYQDTGGAWTVGKGHLVLPTDEVRGQKLHPYGPVSTITKAESDAFFAHDMKIATDTVDEFVHVPLTENQRVALASLAYNIGRSAFKSSTLLRKLNAGDYTGAAAEFNRWIYDNGAIDRVLVARRQRETDLFGSA